MDRLSWCFGLRDGLRITEPNEKLSREYLEQAKSSLLRAEKDLDDGDLLWSTVAMYYAEYYALYSFLQRIGIKCENHSCSIFVVGFLTGPEKVRIINRHKDKRIDAQYYMKVGQEGRIREMLREAKEFVSEFDELVSGLTERDIALHMERIIKAKDKL